MFIFAQDIDDMDADLFSSKKKPSSASVQAKPRINEGSKKDSVESDVKPEGAGNLVVFLLCIDCFLIISFTSSPALKFTQIAIRETHHQLFTQMNPP